MQLHGVDLLSLIRCRCLLKHDSLDGILKLCVNTRFQIVILEGACGYRVLTATPTIPLTIICGRQMNLLHYDSPCRCLCRRLHQVGQVGMGASFVVRT